MMTAKMDSGSYLTQRLMVNTDVQHFYRLSSITPIIPSRLFVGVVGSNLYVEYLFDCICVFRVESLSFWRTIFLVIGGKDIFLSNQ